MSGNTIRILRYMYFITGFLIARYSWFDHDSMGEKSYTTEVELSDTYPDEKFPEWIQKKLDIHGKINPQKVNEDGTKTIEYIKPGAITTVTISSDLKSARIEKKLQNNYELVSFYHRMQGYGGGLKYDLYLFMMDISSLSLFVFGITGIYLWLKILRNKFWGIFFLAGGILYTGWVIFTFLTR